MRLLAVTPLYPPDSRVGAWICTHELLKALVAQGHQVDVVPFLVKPGSPRQYEGVQIYPARSQKQLMAKADVVLSHFGDNGIAHREAVALGKPSIRVIHGGIKDYRQLANSALAICNSNATKATVARWPGPKLVIHPPTDPEKFKTTPGDKVTLVNLSPAKGGDLFWRIARAAPEVEFMGVLGGYGEQIIYKAPNVTIVPNTPNMKEDVYSKTKLLIMPSSAESWGMTAIEAMYSGIPVLAKPTPGLREALATAGNWQSGNTTAQWVGQIRSLLQPDMWAGASERALARVSLLDPEGDRARFVEAVESLVKQKVSA